MSLLKHPAIVSYNVTNWEQAKKFYGETLGLPAAGIADDQVGWMEFGDTEGAHLAIGLWHGTGPLPPHEGGAMAIFAVDDAAKTVEELRRRGVRCDDVTILPGMVAFANFYDPEGNRLQVAGPPPKT